MAKEKPNYTELELLVQLAIAANRKMILVNALNELRLRIYRAKSCICDGTSIDDMMKRLRK